MSISDKVTTFVGALVIALLVAAAFNMYAIRFSTRTMSDILTSTSRCETAQRAMESEETAFHTYIRSRTEENLELLRQAAVHTRSSIDLLPFAYDEIGAERYARTWNIRNAYASYETLRDTVLENYPGDADAVASLYELYNMQGFLVDYCENLSQITVEEGSDAYDEQYPVLHSFPYILIMLSVALLLVVGSLAGFFTSTMIAPITSLAWASMGVMEGDYETPDVVVENRDELGDLVDAFNRMKRAIKNNIKTLEENQSLQERLHSEEIERVNMEKELETIRLDLLQSQINPHFLFNTLNTIAGMAEIEEAGTSAQMIRALSNIFRYNLHTTSQFISLSQELSVMGDYMYLQQMRFGDRLTYEVCLNDVNTDPLMVPVFLLQPLAENAISHGIARKEQGGTVTIEISLDDGILHIKVSDTGVGMTDEVYQQLISELESGVHSHEVTDPEQNTTDRNESHRNLVGIGIGNIYQRIHRIYHGGDMRISTAEGEGTSIELILPQDERILEI